MSNRKFDTPKFMYDEIQREFRELWPWKFLLLLLLELAMVYAAAVTGLSWIAVVVAPAVLMGSIFLLLLSGDYFRAQRERGVQRKEQSERDSIEP